MWEEKSEDVMKAEAVCAVAVDALEVVKIGAQDVLAEDALAEDALAQDVSTVIQEIPHGLEVLGDLGFNPKHSSTALLQARPYILFQLQ
jgi:hypothetical protein